MTSDLLNPAYWLVFGLEWHGDAPLAEAAAAVAPAIIPRDRVGYDAYQVLGCADIYATRHRLRVVFFSDLTAMFTAAGHSWAGLGVDWQNALRELGSGQFPALFLTISEQAYLLLCDPAVRTHTPPSAGDQTGNTRELVRQAITSKLTADWPPYITSLADAGRLRLS